MHRASRKIKRDMPSIGYVRLPGLAQQMPNIYFSTAKKGSRVKSREPGQENIGMYTDSRSWSKNAYIAPQSVSKPRVTAKQDNPPHTYQPADISTTFHMNDERSYRCIFGDKNRARFKPTLKEMEKDLLPGPDVYDTRVHSCKVRRPHKHSPCFAALHKSKVVKGSLHGERRVPRKLPSKQEVLQRRDDIKTPFVAKSTKHKTVADWKDKALGPGQYQNAERGYEYCRSSNRSVSFSKSPHLMGAKLNHDVVIRKKLIESQSLPPTKTASWPRPEYSRDVKAESDNFEKLFWEREKSLNGDDDEDDDFE